MPRKTVWFGMFVVFLAPHNPALIGTVSVQSAPHTTDEMPAASIKAAGRTRTRQQAVISTNWTGVREADSSSWTEPRTSLHARMSRLSDLPGSRATD